MNLDNKINLAEDIVVFENFLTEEECKNLLAYWEHSVGKETLLWEGISFYESYASNLPDDEDLEKFNLPRDFVSNLENKIKEGSEIARNGKLRKVSFHAQKWEPGAFADYHSDNSTNGEYNAFERSKWATFVYLNDDYDGGELQFKDNGVSIKPKAGMMASFNGGSHNEHQVTKITGGHRYTVGSFWDFEECEYSDEKRAEWEVTIAAERIQQAKDIETWAKLKEKGIMLEPGKATPKLEEDK